MTASPLAVDLCVIGAGSGGLSVAAGAVQMGARVALVEKHLMGGDCLNSGCVPSKALLAAGHAYHAARRAARFGLTLDKVTSDTAAAYAHVRQTIAAIAPNDSVERFEGLGVTVVQGAARFVGPTSVQVGEQRIEAKRVVIATGSSAMVPPLSGLDDTPYLTNETIFTLDTVPPRLIIVGGGPIGLEMAQAHRQLGAEVVVLEMFSIMPKDDPELVQVVRERLRHEGVDIREGVKVVATARGSEASAEGVSVTIEQDGKSETVTGSHLLIAAGRRANVAGLDLEAAGIAYSPRGIKVDARLRTSNRKVYAIGDVIGGYQFTHVAGYHASVVIRNALFRLPARVDYQAVPWVTYTDPELAHVGLSEADARQQYPEIKVLCWPFAENDRALAEGHSEGMIKVVCSSRGRILGASIVGHGAGELILPWVLALQQKLKIGAMATVIAPYPTRSEVSKRAAGSYFTASLFSPRTRRLVRWLLRLP